MPCEISTPRTIQLAKAGRARHSAGRAASFMTGCTGALTSAGYRLRFFLKVKKADQKSTSSDIPGIHTGTNHRVAVTIPTYTWMPGEFLLQFSCIRGRTRA